MKIVRQKETKVFKNSAVCTALEYPLGDKDINGAVIELAGRYPDEGWVVNRKCKEQAYIISGSGKLVVDGEETEFREGDLLLIEPGEKYFWEGALTMFVPCAPAWYPEQHEELK